MSMHQKSIDLYTEQTGMYGQTKNLRRDEGILINKYFKGKKVLVLGCGAGRTLLPLHEMGYEVTAIDIVPSMVEATKEHVKGTGITVLEMDAAQLEFANDSFDVVFFPFHGIGNVAPDIYACVREVARVLRAEGVFIFNAHNRYYIKTLRHFFVGNIADYRGLKTYRVDLFDRIKLKRYFKQVTVIQRISLTPWEKSNWKDKVYKLFPLLSKSTYFICHEPKKTNTQ